MTFTALGAKFDVLLKVTACCSLYWLQLSPQIIMVCFLISEMRLWSLLTSPVLPPPPSLCADGQISTVASFKIHSGRRTAKTERAGTL